MEKPLYLLFILSISFSVIGCYDLLHQNSEGTDAEVSGTEDADVSAANQPRQENIAESDGGGTTQNSDSTDDEPWQNRCSEPTHDGTITGVLMDIISLKLPGQTIEVLNNETGERLGISTVTDSEGRFILEGIPHERVGLLAVNIEADYLGKRRIDTYNFGVPSGSRDLEIYSMMDVGALLLLGSSVSQGVASMVYGHVYYYDQNCKLIPVNCATVQVDRPVDVLYSDGMMASIPPESETTEVGIFMFSSKEMAEDSVAQVTALVDDQPIGKVSFPWIFPEPSKKLPNFHFINIYADNIGDPTPDCLR